MFKTEEKPAALASKEKNTISVRVMRQKGPDDAPYWDEFEVPYQPNMNVISVLMEIRLNPVNSAGKKVTPPSWESGCLECVCGVCSMNINGVPRQACVTLVDHLEQPIELKPFTKFPVIRDLVVDRTRMFEALKRVKAWVPLDGTYEMGAGPRISPEKQQDMYAYAQCMTCGCCLEACPQYHEDNAFIGAHAIGQAYLFNENPIGAHLKDDRLEELMGPGGVVDCGNAQNCVKVCPKFIPLTDAIAAIGGQVTKAAFKKMFRF
ncbi:MAG: succinate dehydrogenase iron-sulfur subunit [Sumerlaeia bacterium]